MSDGEPIVIPIRRMSGSVKVDLRAAMNGPFRQPNRRRKPNRRIRKKMRGLVMATAYRRECRAVGRSLGMLLDAMRLPSLRDVE